jgi:hypothetical protein
LVQEITLIQSERLLETYQCHIIILNDSSLPIPCSITILGIRNSEFERRNCLFHYFLGKRKRTPQSAERVWRGKEQVGKIVVPNPSQIHRQSNDAQRWKSDNINGNIGYAK